MSVIQKLYPWSQLRLKDYIVKPKPNGYQSLHATQLVPDVTDMSRHGRSVAVEFQVRDVWRYFHSCVGGYCTKVAETKRNETKRASGRACVA